MPNPIIFAVQNAHIWKNIWSQFPQTCFLHCAGDCCMRMSRQLPSYVAKNLCRCYPSKYYNVLINMAYPYKISMWVYIYFAIFSLRKTNFILNLQQTLFLSSIDYRILMIFLEGKIQDFFLAVPHNFLGAFNSEAQYNTFQKFNCNHPFPVT